MSAGLISILTPFKNTGKYIRDCIDSIVEQSYSNWELILVNDHSTDQSLDIIKEYIFHDNRIKVYDNTGKGIIPALRKGFKESTGAYITRMDSDDIMAKNRLETMLKDLQQNGAGHVALGQVKYFGKSGINDGYLKYEKWLNNLTKRGQNYREIYKECVIPSPCWMVCREDLIKVNAFNPDRYPEDYDLTFRFYEHGIKCISTSALLHFWRDYPNRTSRTHPHYAQNSFLELKMYYFLKLDYDSRRILTIWGAGFKGKTIAKILVKNKIDFQWICNNPKKIGKKIYGKELMDFESLGRITNPQCIITVANPKSQARIRSYMKTQEMHAVKDYFFFC